MLKTADLICPISGERCRIERCAWFDIGEHCCAICLIVDKAYEISEALGNIDSGLCDTIYPAPEEEN